MEGLSSAVVLAPIEKGSRFDVPNFSTLGGVSLLGGSGGWSASGLRSQ